MIKDLKNYKFEWDEIEKILYVGRKNKDGIRESIVAMSKPSMFSLCRFILRIAQKGKPRKKK